MNAHPKAVTIIATVEFINPKDGKPFEWVMGTGATEGEIIADARNWAVKKRLLKPHTAGVCEARVKDIEEQYDAMGRMIFDEE